MDFLCHVVLLKIPLGVVVFVHSIHETVACYTWRLGDSEALRLSLSQSRWIFTELLSVEFCCILSLEGISPGINDEHCEGLAVGISHLQK